jgi:SDR family mycofactocin-dependent oxidoreductase
MSMGRLDGKVAFITGAARGQGRSHALRLAHEGARVVALDACGAGEAHHWLPYRLSTKEDLAETARQVEACGVGIVARQGDVRSLESLQAAVEQGLDTFGHIDIVTTNAGIAPTGRESWLADDRQWTDVYEVNLLGARNACKAVLPAMIAAERGGSIVMTSSTLGLKGAYGMADYSAAKWGIIGFARSLANEVGPYGIRVNVIAPGAVDTDMIQHETLRRAFRPDLDQPTRDDFAAAFAQLSMLQIPWVEPIDISNALLFLASDEARYITGVVLPVDAGTAAK